MPSAGDWTLHRGGAITLDGVSTITVENCSFIHLDGNAISINGFARDVNISSNHFEFIGESAITLWGRTSQGVGRGNVSLPAGVGIDGTLGEQPRGTVIMGNLIHELGAYQKQASAVFSAVACETRIEQNIFFNGYEHMHIMRNSVYHINKIDHF